MHTFERYREELMPILNSLRENLPPFFVVERELKYMELPNGCSI